MEDANKIEFIGIEPTTLSKVNTVGILPKLLEVREGKDIRECRVKFYNARHEAKDHTILLYSSMKGKEPDVILETQNSKAIPTSYDSCRLIGDEITNVHKLNLYF